MGDFFAGNCNSAIYEIIIFTHLINEENNMPNLKINGIGEFEITKELDL